MDDKDAKIVELEALIVALKKQLSEAYRIIDIYQDQNRKRSHYDHDYLDYEDDRR